jgi:hypothetical protein
MSNAAYFKTACDHCKGHIEYPATVAGEIAACPHCGHQTLLPYVPTQSPAKHSGFALTKDSTHKGRRGPLIEPEYRGAVIFVSISLLVIVFVFVWVFSQMSFREFDQLVSSDLMPSIPTGQIFGIVIFLFLLLIGLMIYFFPSYMAFKRNHKNFVAILALNLLTGWSFVGWVIALVWALKVE